MVTVGLVSYKRPLFLAECIKSMYRKPGMPFELLIWSNDIDNKGSYALKDIFEKVKTKYFVVVEEDEIWFQDNWLKELVEAFEQKPAIKFKSKDGKWAKEEWGVLASNTLWDKVNGGSIPYSNILRFKQGKFTYWTGIRAGGGVMIFNTEVLRGLNAFEQPKHLNGILYPLEVAYDSAGYPQGRVENIYIYHAYSPYWNSLYPKVFEEKQGGQTIEEAKKQFNCDYNDKKPMREFLSGNFNKYAKKIYFNNRRQGVHRIEIGKVLKRLQSGRIG